MSIKTGKYREWPCWVRKEWGKHFIGSNKNYITYENNIRDRTGTPSLYPKILEHLNLT